jgi:hypothetical protein
MRVAAWVVALRVSAMGLGLIGMAGCQPASRLVERAKGDAPMFAPTELRVHPFTSVKDWTSDGNPDGVEALVELQDRFGDPTKATGTVLFELYTYRRDYPDVRGNRLAAWRGSVMTLEEQRMHWNRISRTYSFQLAYPDIRETRSYVLVVWFDHAGKRLVSQVVMEAQEAKDVAGPPTEPPAPTTGRTTQPSTAPSGGGARPGIGF